MSSFIKTLLFSAVIIITPFYAYAVKDVNELFTKFGSILNAIIPLIIGLAVVIFLFGIIKYITAGSDEEKRDEGRNTMIYGIIAIFVMVSVWGLVGILKGTFDVTEESPQQQIPKIPVIPGV